MGATSGDKRSREIRFSSGVAWGEGEGRVTWATKKGSLCGSGETSIISIPGEDEGMGGVVACSISIGGVSSRPCSPCQLGWGKRANAAIEASACTHQRYLAAERGWR